MLSTRRLIVGSVLTTLATVVACEGSVSPNCTSELRWEIAPTSRTLAVGSLLTPRGTMVTCGGSEREPARLVLLVPDTSVVALRDSARSVQAVAAGAVQVQVQIAAAPDYGPVGTIAIVVAPRD